MNKEVKQDDAILTITDLNEQDVKFYNKGAKRTSKRTIKNKLPILKTNETVLNISMLDLHHWLYYEGMQTSNKEEFEFYSKLNSTQNIIKWNDAEDKIKILPYN